MYLYDTSNEWLTEHCLLCGSVNHIFLDNPNATAWECWGCYSRWWLDDLAQSMFIIENNVDVDEADDMVTNAHPLIIFLNGQCSE